MSNWTNLTTALSNITTFMEDNNYIYNESLLEKLTAGVMETFTKPQYVITQLGSTSIDSATFLSTITINIIFVNLYKNKKIIEQLNTDNVLISNLHKTLRLSFMSLRGINATPNIDTINKQISWNIQATLNLKLGT